MPGRIGNLLTRVRRDGPVAAANFALVKARAALAKSDLGWKVGFVGNPFVRTGSSDDYTRQADAVWQELQQLPNVTCETFPLDANNYRAYIERARYTDFDPYYRGGMSGNEKHRTDKLLQHYLSLQMLDVQPGDVYIDVASNTSPMNEVVRRLYSIPTYRLDLSFPPGIDGDRIGGDAGDTKLPVGFASKMSLHCSFEHFANGADTRFVRECDRLLPPGGKVCIVPLYVLEHYAIRRDPCLEEDISVRDPEGAPLVYVRDYWVPYARWYDPQRLKERVLDHLGGLRATIYRVTGLEALAPDLVYSHFALVLEK